MSGQGGQGTSAPLPQQAIMSVSNDPADEPHASSTAEQQEAAKRAPQNITLTPKDLTNIPLEGPYPSTDTLMSQSLWATRPVVLIVIRRLGCPLCRGFAHHVSERRSEFERTQCDVVLIADQRLYAKDFTESVWPLPLYFDLGGAFKTALGNRPAFTLCMLSPQPCYKFACTPLPKAGDGHVCFPAGTDDMNEHGTIRGGELVVARYGIFLQTSETVAFGHSSVDRILQACRLARGI